MNRPKANLDVHTRRRIKARAAQMHNIATTLSHLTTPALVKLTIAQMEEELAAVRQIIASRSAEAAEPA